MTKLSDRFVQFEVNESKRDCRTLFIRRKYWTNRDSGNRLVLPLFITPPKDQQPILM